MNTNPLASFLHPIDLSQTLKETGDLAMRVAESSADFRRDFASIASWWSAISVPPERLLGLLYLRAQEQVASSKPTSVNDVARRVNRANAMLRSFDRRAVDSVITNVESRVADSKSLTRRLALAQEELQELAPTMEEFARKLVPTLQGSDVERDVPAEATGAAVTAQAWGCYLNGVRISCWLAVALVLLVILL